MLELELIISSSSDSWGDSLYEWLILSSFGDWLKNAAAPVRPTDAFSQSVEEHIPFSHEDDTLGWEMHIMLCAVWSSTKLINERILTWHSNESDLEFL